MSDSKENVDVLKMYGEDSTTQRDEFLKKHNLNENGLTSKQAEINIKKVGLNETKKRLNLRSGIIIYYKVY